MKARTSRLSAAVGIIAVLVSLIPATYVRGQETNSLAISLIPGIWVTGLAGARYRVEYADSLTMPSPVWSFLTNITLLQSPTLITDYSAISNRTRFYRSLRAPFAADSFFQFSGQQGSNGWFYGYYDGTGPSPYSPPDFKPMTHGPEYQAFIGSTGSVWYVTPDSHWTAIGPDWVHPNGTRTERQQVIHWVVRRWQSSVAGAVRVTVDLADKASRADIGDNGVASHIFLDGAEVSYVVLPVGDSQQIVLNLTLQTGSILDFAIDSINGVDIFDATIQKIFIETIQ